GLNIAAMVYVQVDVAPAYALLEAQSIAQLAVHEPRLQGIVAWAPLEDGECVRSILDALVAIGPLVKGVRRILQGEPDPAYCLQPSFIRGVEMLAEYGLSFDICIYHHQLPAVIELVRQCPGVTFILDHIAKPDIRSGAFEPWREHIATLARLPNVVCKISGVATEADHMRWTVDDLAPYIRHALEAFGEDRVMFGGDWPVALLATNYRRWVETLATLTVDLSPEAQRKLWAENARRVYRLPSVAR
ncbi:MAG: amidohydrolase family protein, partial [Roseiflexus sp.]|nr:amidohydrolase family protein [Roseiflexus sp.]